MRTGFFSFVGLFFFIISKVIFADEVPILQPPIKKSDPVNMSFSIFDNSTFYGSALTNLGSNTAPAADPGENWGLSSHHEHAVQYKLTNLYTLSAALQYYYQFSDPLTSGASNGFHWDDGYLKIKANGLLIQEITGGRITLNSDLYYYVPASKYSRTNSSLGSVRLSLNPSLQFDRSNISISTVNYARYYLQNNDRNTNGTRALPLFEMYTGTQVNYHFSDRVTAYTLYELLFDTRGIWWTDNAFRTLADVEPTVDIKVNDNVIISPFLNWYTNQSLNTTSINLTANIKLL